MQSLPWLAPFILRGGVVILFLWFGLSQVVNPDAWVSWVPAWAATVIGPRATVLLNGGFEIILGVALAAGFYTRLVALFLSLHLFFIAYEVGYNDIGVRDFSLALATLALALMEPDPLTFDRRASSYGETEEL